MLNYIDNFVYLPNMALLKWGVRVFGECRGYYGSKSEVYKAPPHGTILNN